MRRYCVAIVLAAALSFCGGAVWAGDGFSSGGENGTGRAAVLGIGNEKTDVTFCRLRIVNPDGVTSYEWRVWDCGLYDVYTRGTKSVTVAGPGIPAGEGVLNPYCGIPDAETWDLQWPILKECSWGTLDEFKSECGVTDVVEYTFTITYNNGSTRTLVSSFDLTGATDANFDDVADKVSIKRNGVELFKGVPNNNVNTNHVLDPCDDRNVLAYDWSDAVSDGKSDVLVARNVLKTYLKRSFSEQEYLADKRNGAALAGTTSTSINFNSLYPDGDKTKKTVDWRTRFVNDGYGDVIFRPHGMPEQMVGSCRVVVLPDLVFRPVFRTRREYRDAGNGMFASSVVTWTGGQLEGTPIKTGNSDYEVIAMSATVGGKAASCASESGGWKGNMDVTPNTAYYFQADATGLTGLKPIVLTATYRNGKKRTLTELVDFTPPALSFFPLSNARVYFEGDPDAYQISPLIDLSKGTVEKFRVSWSPFSYPAYPNAMTTRLRDISGEMWGNYPDWTFGPYSGTVKNLYSSEQDIPWNQIGLLISGDNWGRASVGIRIDYPGNITTETLYRVRSTNEYVYLRAYPSDTRVYAGSGFNVSLVIDADSAEMYDAVEGHIGFDPSVFSIKSVTPSNTFPVVLQKPVIDNAAGKLDFAYGMQPGGSAPKGTKTFANLYVEVSNSAVLPAGGENLAITWFQNTGEWILSDVTFGGKSVLGVERNASGDVIGHAAENAAVTAYPATKWVRGRLALGGNQNLLNKSFRVDIIDLEDATASYDHTVGTDSTGLFGFPMRWTLSDDHLLRFDIRRLGNVRDSYGNRDPKSLKKSVEVQYKDLLPATVLAFGTLEEGDVNLDGKINILDFSRFTIAFNRTNGEFGYDERSDLNEDGIVNLLDFSLLSTNFGKSEKAAANAVTTQETKTSGAGGCSAGVAGSICFLLCLPLLMGVVAKRRL